MSYLNNFRLSFSGGCSFNPCTANNDDVGLFVMDPVNGSLAGDFADLSDEEAQHKLKQLTQNGSYVSSGWNFFGDYAFLFKQLGITSAGMPGDINPLSEPLPFYFLGSVDPTNQHSRYGSPIMIDMDPTGTSCSRVIFGGLLIGDDMDNPLLKITGNVSSANYYIDPRSIKAGGFSSFMATWQVSYAYDDSWIVDESNETIKALMDEVKKNKGITINFSIFEMAPAILSQNLSADFNEGKGTMNPVIGYTIGNIGVWEADELASSPSGRVISPTHSIKSKETIGSSAFFSIDQNNTLSIDLSKCFIKKSPRFTISSEEALNDPAKNKERINQIENVGQIGPNVTLDGELKLVTFDNDGNIKTQFDNTIDYDNENYFKTGGVVDVAMNADDITEIENNPVGLILTNSDNDPITLLSEEIYVIRSEDKYLYINPNETNPLNFKIEKLGKPLSPSDSIEIEFDLEFTGTLQAEFDQHKALNIALTSAVGNLNTVSEEEGNEKYTLTITGKEANGCALDLGWIVGGYRQINFSKINGIKNSFYAVAKTYQNDDYSHMDESDKFTWDFVYPEVLRYYYVIFPAMSLRLPLNNETLITDNVYAEVLKRISDQYRDTSLFMPMTHVMSPGKTTLLRQYLEYSNNLPLT
ncbi:hypothetical protein [Aureibacter tunicatorum]|uniref:Uncharacterized protein n=1 Tax=Aureibacter tunicatorum TaxID=866807 RepID=A0AAE3XKK7_9BACT|nr:hypothetical protein [Aureibacter tunicatorum]MDR6239541.1 hypothetical protein [Aureibacter tunicatorum]BDD04018.1 hypothetical protein AUTU_15010 [Aureibacter tunicatorum]